LTPYCKGDNVLYMQLGDCLRKWRKMSDLTVRDAAKRIGIGFAAYSRIERGATMDGVTLAAILRWMLTEEKGKG
jgi:transcriptional regulator with XRE-family HTH domain